MNLSVNQVNWEEAKEELLQVRYSVFVEEQGVPKEIEQDEMDPVSIHVLIREGRQPIATGRLLTSGYIGRVAVLKQYRGKGYGIKVMEKLESLAREEGLRVLKLSSQTHASGFYLKLGYKVKGEEYSEAGIPHISMLKEI